MLSVASQVCHVVPGQRIPAQFLPQVAADMVAIAAVPPSNRFNKVRGQPPSYSTSDALTANRQSTPQTDKVCRRMYLINIAFVGVSLRMTPSQIVNHVQTFRAAASGLVEAFGLQLTNEVHNHLPPRLSSSCPSLSHSIHNSRTPCLAVMTWPACS